MKTKYNIVAPFSYDGNWVVLAKLYLNYCNKLIPIESLRYNFKTKKEAEDFMLLRILSE
jgi:hypothetical protein